MMKCCKECGVEIPQKDLYCRKHGRQLLKRLEASGYLEPLTVQTVNGTVKLSTQRFLTLPQGGTLPTQT